MRGRRGGRQTLEEQFLRAREKREQTNNPSSCALQEEAIGSPLLRGKFGGGRGGQEESGGEEGDKDGLLMDMVAEHEGGESSIHHTLHQEGHRDELSPPS
jgi:hypothetical protein